MCNIPLQHRYICVGMCVYIGAGNGTHTVSLSHMVVPSERFYGVLYWIDNRALVCHTGCPLPFPFFFFFPHRPHRPQKTGRDIGSAPPNLPKENRSTHAKVHWTQTTYLPTVTVHIKQPPPGLASLVGLSPKLFSSQTGRRY